MTPAAKPNIPIRCERSAKIKVSSTSGWEGRHCSGIERAASHQLRSKKRVVNDVLVALGAGHLGVEAHTAPTVIHNAHFVHFNAPTVNMKLYKVIKKYSQPFDFVITCAYLLGEIALA